MLVGRETPFYIPKAPEGRHIAPHGAMMFVRGTDRLVYKHDVPTELRS